MTVASPTGTLLKVHPPALPVVPVISPIATVTPSIGCSPSVTLTLILTVVLSSLSLSLSKEESTPFQSNLH